MIADGKHVAKLFDISRFTTENGQDAVSFVWDLDCGERLPYALSLFDERGNKNIYGIQLTRRWATGWNGQDLDWFAEHLTECRLLNVVMTTRGGKLDWVTGLVDGAQGLSALPTGQPNENPSSPSATANPTNRTCRIRLVVDQERLAEMPEDIAPTFEEAKTLFDAITEGTDKFDADKVWTIIAKKVGPMQIDFGEAEWQQMINRIRQLKCWEGVVSA